MSGWEAATAASHVTVVFAVALLALEVVLLGRRAEAVLRVATSAGPRIGLYITGLAVVTERLYYVLARTTAHRGANLWGWHPIPELLSGAVATAVFLAWALVATEAVGGWRRARWSVAIHGAFLVLLWAMVALTLRTLG